MAAHVAVSRERLAGKRAEAEAVSRPPVPLSLRLERTPIGTSRAGAGSAPDNVLAQGACRQNGCASNAYAAAVQCARAAGTGAASPLLLRLQRQYGNRFVGRVLASPQKGRAVKAASVARKGGVAAGPRPGAGVSSPDVQRFGSEEHVRIGDTAVPGQSINIEPGLPPVTYGEIVAMAGDYFESIEQIRQLASDPLFGRDEVLYVLWLVNPSQRREPLVSQAVVRAVDDRYNTLASRNQTHFSTGSAPGQSNRERYIDRHTDAIAAAYSEGATGIIHSTPWQAREAFTAHFLSDAFSAGHVRTPRGEIQTHWNGLYPNFENNLVRMISCWMASYINDRDRIGWVATVNMIANRIDPVLRHMAGSKLSAFSIGDLVSKVLHDADNAGLDVISPRGPGGSATGSPFHWRAVGDSHLYPAAGAPASQPQQMTQQMVTEAVRLSFEEAQQAYAAGRSHGATPLTNFTNPAGFRALNLIPTADPASVTNPVYPWRQPNIRALPPVIKNMIRDVFTPGHEIRDGLDTLPVPCTYVADLGVDFNLHTRDAWTCFKNMLLADPFEAIARVCEGSTLCPPGNDNPCPTLRNPCP